MTNITTLNPKKQSKYVSLEFATLLSILALSLAAVVNHSLLISGDTLYASVIFAGISFLLAIRFLKLRNVGRERIFIALTSTVSGIWLYELVYHYSYLDYMKNSIQLDFSYLFSDLRFLTFNTDGGQFPIVWAIIMIALPLVGYKYMQLNKFFALTLVASMFLFWIWVQVGYPQFTDPQAWPIMTPTWFLIPASYAYSGSQIIVSWGYFFNSVTKILTVVPSLLFYTRKRREPTKLNSE